MQTTLSLILGNSFLSVVFFVFLHAYRINSLGPSESLFLVIQSFLIPVDPLGILILRKFEYLSHINMRNDSRNPHLVVEAIDSDLLPSSLGGCLLLTRVRLDNSIRNVWYSNLYISPQRLGFDHLFFSPPNIP